MNEVCILVLWRLGLVVARWSQSTRLRYARPVSTGMDDHVLGQVMSQLLSRQLSLLPSVGQKIVRWHSAVG